MIMFSNKHVVVAMLVAPVLAIMAWFAVDHFIGEKPHAAKPGESYSLLARSNCRYDSGQCDLVNGDFELTLRPKGMAETSVGIELVSKHALQRATIGLAEAGAPPSAMAATDATAMRWTTAISQPVADDSTLRVAVIAEGATYYAEVPVVFLRFENDGTG